MKTRYVKPRKVVLEIAIKRSPVWCYICRRLNLSGSATSTSSALTFSSLNMAASAAC